MKFSRKLLSSPPLPQSPRLPHGPLNSRTRHAQSGPQWRERVPVTSIIGSGNAIAVPGCGFSILWKTLKKKFHTVEFYFRIDFQTVKTPWEHADHGTSLSNGPWYFPYCGNSPSPIKQPTNASQRLGKPKNAPCLGYLSDFSHPWRNPTNPYSSKPGPFLRLEPIPTQKHPYSAMCSPI